MVALTVGTDLSRMTQPFGRYVHVELVMGTTVTLDVRGQNAAGFPEVAA
jgi:hypothetical protein